MMTKKSNEYEQTFYKESDYINIYKEFEKFNKFMNNKLLPYPKYQNFLYIISGTDDWKNKLVIKLDDGKIFIKEVQKHRISPLNSDTQHYLEYKNNTWIPFEEFDYTTWFSNNPKSYIYFSEKFKINHKLENVKIRIDNTFFIDINKMNIIKKIQYLELEANKHLNLFDKSDSTYKFLEHEYDFLPLVIEKSKLRICQTLKAGEIHGHHLHFENFIFSNFICNRTINSSSSN